MSILFEPIRIAGLDLRNRFVRSATFDALADEEGFVTEAQIRLMTDLADGGVGLIVSPATNVHAMAKVRPLQTEASQDRFVPGLRHLTDAVHDHGAKIALQLVHAGRFSAAYFKTLGRTAISSYYAGDDPYFELPYRTMTEEEIEEAIAAFGDAARRGREAGFDAVQIHACHGTLPSQFLSPFVNRREDRWGGTPANRLRFHCEVLADMRRKTGDDYPLLIKFGVQDGFPEGLRFDEGLQAATELAERGFDALEVSGGMRGTDYAHWEMKTGIDSIDKEAYYRDWARTVKQAVDVPVMAVGGLRTFSLMEEIVAAGDADLVSICRPFIREPDLVAKWRVDPHHRPTCISCNKCNQAVAVRKPLRCYQPETM